MRQAWAVIACIAALVANLAAEPLKPWTPGTLDIHQIHTGRGNATFLILPDGTTLLIDAGAVPERSAGLVPARSNASRTPAEWIARYIRQVSPRDPAEIDYAVATHYHDDHVGALAALAGIIPIRTLIDRGDDPPPPPFPAIRDYLAFRARFTGARGKPDEIRPRHSGADFEVRAVAGNGQVGGKLVFPADWRKRPALDQPNENHFSLAFLIRSGAFRYFTGGDLIGVALDGAPAWHDLETPVARLVGPVDALLLNHHGFLDTSNEFFLQTLAPRVVVVPAWHATHPDHSVMRRLRSPRWKPSPPDVFLTALHEAPRTVFSYLPSSFRSTEGHVVIRVAPGGGSYEVIVLDAEQETLPVKSRFGPYVSKSGPAR